MVDATTILVALQIARKNLEEGRKADDYQLSQSKFNDCNFLMTGVINELKKQTAEGGKKADNAGWQALGACHGEEISDDKEKQVEGKEIRWEKLKWRG